MSYIASNWATDRWPNFRHAELACQETGECAMAKPTMDRLSQAAQLMSAPQHRVDLIFP